MTLSDPAVTAAVIAASAAFGAAIFAFFAALINAAVARRNAILSAQIAQRTKRAEFRQAWINQLRDSFSKMFASFADPSGPDRQAAEEGARVLLMLNRKDPDYDRITSAIHTCVQPKKVNPDDLLKAQREFIAASQDILKREWGVIKAEIGKFETDAKKTSTIARRGLAVALFTVAIVVTVGIFL